MDEDRVGALIEGIYTPAFEADGWVRLCHDLRIVFQASNVNTIGYDCAQKAMVFGLGTGSGSSCIDDYLGYYHKLESILPVYQNNPQALQPLTAFPIQAVIDRDEHLQSELYNDFQRHYDLCLPLNAMLDIPGLDFTHFLVDRPLGSPEFGCEELKLLTTLTPHLSRGLRIYREMTGLRAKAGLVETVFDMLAATFQLDHAGRVRSLNKKAETLLSENSPLTVQNGRLTARYPPDNASLAVALAPPAPGAPPPELVLRGAACCPSVRLSITPMNGRDIPMFFDVTHMARVAFLVTAVMPGPTVQNLITRYGLTRAEAEITLLLLADAKAPQIAAHRETSIGTVNSQIKHIYAKTGADGHAGLLVLLLGR